MSPKNGVFFQSGSTKYIETFSVVSRCSFANFEMTLLLHVSVLLWVCKLRGSQAQVHSSCVWLYLLLSFNFTKRTYVFHVNIVTFTVRTYQHHDHHKKNGYLFFIYLKATEFPEIAECQKIKSWCWLNRVFRIWKKYNSCQSWFLDDGILQFWT
jgi:hypothetical protein